MQLGITIPLQKHQKWKNPPYAQREHLTYAWDLHIITLQGRTSLLAVHAQTRYTFVCYDLRLEWQDLSAVFLQYLQISLQNAGFSAQMVQNYCQKAGACHIVKTHGRSAVAHLNRAWEDVLQADYFVNNATMEQPVVDALVNQKISNTAGAKSAKTAQERMQIVLEEMI